MTVYDILKYMFFHSLHFIPSLQFQSAIYTYLAFCTWSAVCSLRSADYTDRRCKQGKPNKINLFCFFLFDNAA
jgi:hypothetical protein